MTDDLRQRFPDYDDYLIHISKLGTKRFLEGIAKMDLMEPIVEVGAMSLVGGCAKVFEKHPETYVDSRKLFAGKQYLSMDIDPAGGADITGDFMDAVSVLGKQSVGSLIMVSVLDHLPFWDTPAIIADILKSGGRAYLRTSWNFRLHGPRPLIGYPCDDGYRLLFGREPFVIESLQKIECPGRPLAPVGFTVVVKRD